MVLDHLKERGITSGQNDVFLTGLSNGGGLTLLAASKNPELFRGIAPFMPYLGEAFPPPPAPSEGLNQMLLVYSLGDPGLPASHDALLEELTRVWGESMGLGEEDLLNPTESALPNSVHEGQDYEGSQPVVLATRNSSVIRNDYAASSSAAKIRVLTIENGGHFWPHPVQDDSAWILEQWGLRNQDFDGAEAVWEFFKSQ
jgi:poly(3-hydroxybutyrate) depolymerase